MPDSRRVALGALALVNMLAVPAAARTPAPEPLPLGLEKITWAMNSDAALPLLTALGPRVPKPADWPMTDHLSIFIQPYRWKDCSFRTEFDFFAGDRLDAATLEADLASQSCQDAALAALRRQYGEGERDLRDAGGLPTTVRWHSGQADIVFRGYATYSLSVKLTLTGGHPVTIYDFVQTDRSAIEKPAPGPDKTN